MLHEVYCDWVVDPESLAQIRFAHWTSLPQTPLTLPHIITWYLQELSYSYKPQFSLQPCFFLCHFGSINTTLDMLLEHSWKRQGRGVLHSKGIHSYSDNPIHSKLSEIYQEPTKVSTAGKETASYVCNQINFMDPRGILVATMYIVTKQTLLLLWWTWQTRCTSAYIPQGCPRTCHNWHILHNWLTQHSAFSASHRMSDKLVIWHSKVKKTY